MSCPADRSGPCWCYLTERSAGMDYSSVLNLVGKLVGGFWKDLEIHQPGIDSLRLPSEVAEAWKQRASFKRECGAVGQPRRERYQLLFAVRTFYLDIAQWAVEDPSWVGWVAPSPERAEDVRGVQKYKRGRTAAMRTTCQPRRCPPIPRRAWPPAHSLPSCRDRLRCASVLPTLEPLSTRDPS